MSMNALFVTVFWLLECDGGSLLWWWQDHPAMVSDLDIVDEDDQITHMLALEDGDNPEDGLSQ